MSLAFSGSTRGGSSPQAKGTDMEQLTVIQLELPADYRFLKVARSCLAAILEQVEDLVEPDTLRYNLQLALQEVCANIVGHAYAGQPEGRIQITFNLELASRKLTIELHDTGRSFNPEAVPDPNLDEAQLHGYGLFIIRELMDELSYNAQTDGNRWRLVKNLGKK